MNGTFSGIRLARITSLKTTVVATETRVTTFRVIGHKPKLQQIVRLCAPALLILSSAEIDGKIVHDSADAKIGYEITIEAKL